MGDLISDAAALIAAHQDRAAPLLAILAFAECLAGVGVLFPATATMIMVGGLIGAGLLDPVAAGLAASAGAIAGGWLSFHLGRWMGPGTLRRWPFSQHRGMTARARLFFRRHGVLSIILARFYGPTRATIPLAAGVLRMRRRVFELANIGSALVWVASLFSLGWLAARSTDLGSLPHGARIMVFVAMAIVTSMSCTVGARKIFIGAPRERARHA